MSVKINLLFRGCNLRCPMCSMNANRADLPQILRDYPGASTGPELTLDEYKRVFPPLKKQKPIVSIGGGEPFLNQQGLFAALEAAGDEVELLIIPSGSHMQIKDSSQSMEAVEAFISRIITSTKK